MFIYNGKEYENVWFTSDEHYGSGRHIPLSCRMGFEDYEKEKRINYLENELAKTDLTEGIQKAISNLMKHSIYGSTINMSNPVDQMNKLLIDRHNERVGKNDIVFHVGDFGDYNYASELNGDHVLILGNYEHDDIFKNYDSSIKNFHETITKKYNFIDVIEDYMFDLSKNNKNNIRFGDVLHDDVDKIYITHKPLNCHYDFERNKLIKFKNDQKITMNIFGHIHEKCKVKRYGINVGVDAHHFYPMAKEEVGFYLYAILHYYDSNVFC